MALLPASFNRVDFFVSNISVGFGRRGVMHQSPFNDKPFFEDLGRKGRIITVDAHVMSQGSDSQGYESDRDSLMRTIENGGSGVFVHPTMGSLNVVPTDCVTTFNNSEGRIEKFTITFAEEGAQPSTQRDLSSDVKSSVLTYGGVSEATYTVEYKAEKYKGPSENNKTKKIPPIKDSFLQGITREMKKYLDKMDKFARITQTTKDISQFSKDFLELSKTMQSFPQLIIGSISETYNSVQTLITGLSIATSNPLDRLKNALSLFNVFFEDGKETQSRYSALRKSSVSSDSQSYRSAQAEDAFFNLILSFSIQEIASSTIESEFTTIQDVLEYKEQINSAFNNLALKVGDGDNLTSYEGLLTLQKTVNEYLNDQIEKLPEIKIIENTKVRPALVIAYNQHEDTEKAFEMVDRNGVSNPNMVPTGALEVIIDE